MLVNLNLKLKLELLKHKGTVSQCAQLRVHRTDPLQGLEIVDIPRSLIPSTSPALDRLFPKHSKSSVLRDMPKMPEGQLLGFGILEMLCHRYIGPNRSLSVINPVIFL
jgi:hypothetical protein